MPTVLPSRSFHYSAGEEDVDDDYGLNGDEYVSDVGDMESFDSCSMKSPSHQESPLQLLPKIDPNSKLLAGWTESSVSGGTSFSSLDSFNERRMLPPGAVIKGPWTREVFRHCRLILY
jgi:hypothetical protein